MKKRLFVLPLLLCACTGSPVIEENRAINFALRVARGVGDAVLRQKGAAEFTRSIPELMPAIDIGADGMVTLGEVEDFLLSAKADPESVALLVATLALLK